MVSKTFLALGAVAAMALASGTAMAGKDEGAKVFTKCKACHEAEPGKHKVGPSLFGVYGRKAGTAAGFDKYKGLVGADWTWDDATLDEYLEDPKKFTKERTGKNATMVLKLKKKEERGDVIEYLKSLK